MTQAIASLPHCRHIHLPLDITGYSSHQLTRTLRKRLTDHLKSHANNPAFQDLDPKHIYPRADDVEAMIAAYPNLHLLNYDDPDCPCTTIDLEAWKFYHAKHCSNRCTATYIDPLCYFKPLAHMLRTGFHPALLPGESIDSTSFQHAVPSYVTLWHKEPQRCAKAFKKLVLNDFTRPVDGTPPLCFPLLPVIKSKDLWRFHTQGIDYKVRLTSDTSSAGVNAKFQDIKFRYWGADDFARLVLDNDNLFSLDIEHFYTDLGAGPLLRLLQCFQDPATYGTTLAENAAIIAEGKAKFIQQLTCMFGFKQLPWWASCVSGELCRILTHQGCQVVGCIIDDILMRSPADDGDSMAHVRYRRAKRIMRVLGVPPNDKGIPPTTSLVFGGLQLNTCPVSMSISAEHRAYAIARLNEFIAKRNTTTRDVKSLAGTLSWLCYVMPEGRPRRDQFYKTIREAKGQRVPISAELRRQARWWLNTLTSNKFSSSIIWPLRSKPPSILMRTDASGDSGFGVCVRNLHIFGSWRSTLAPLILHNMLFKEMLPFAIASSLLAPLHEDHIFADCSDNAGMVFRTNAGSARDPLVQRLLRFMARLTTVWRVTFLADWNNRESPDARHADQLSKTFSPSQWQALAASAQRVTSKSWLFDLVIHDMHTGQVISAVFRIPRMD